MNTVLRTLAMAFVFASFIATGCRKEGTYPPEPPVVVIVVDGGGQDYDEPFDAPGGYVVPECAAACATLRALDCEDGFRRPGEDTCYVLCKRAQLSGVMDFKPGCVAGKTSKAAVRSCGTYRCLR